MTVASSRPAILMAVRPGPARQRPRGARGFIAASVAVSVQVSPLELLQCFGSVAGQLTLARGTRPLDRRKAIYGERATFGWSPCAVH
jgi:hypothetical protein